MSAWSVNTGHAVSPALFGCGGLWSSKTPVVLKNKFTPSPWQGDEFRDLPIISHVLPTERRQSRPHRALAACSRGHATCRVVAHTMLLRAKPSKEIRYIDFVSDVTQASRAWLYRHAQASPTDRVVRPHFVRGCVSACGLSLLQSTRRRRRFMALHGRTDLLATSKTARDGDGSGVLLEPCCGRVPPIFSEEFFASRALNPTHKPDYEK